MMMAFSMAACFYRKVAKARRRKVIFKGNHRELGGAGFPKWWLMVVRGAVRRGVAERPARRDGQTSHTTTSH